MCAIEDDMQLVLDSVICLATITVRRSSCVPSSSLITEGVNTESESGHAANDIMRSIKEHVFRKRVGRSYNQGPVCSWGAPLVVGQPFAVKLSRMCV